MTLSRFRLVVLFVASIAVALGSFAAEPLKEVAPSVLTDASGREVTLKKWKIIGGTRKLSWLPEKIDAFEMREFGSTTFKDGVLTFVPLSRIEAIRYEYDKQTANLHVAGLDKPLQGTTKYKDINTITIAAEVDQGASGVADLRYQGGVLKVGFKEIKFSGAKAPDAPTPKGDLFSFLILPEGKGKNGVVMTATGVQALYRFDDGSEKLLSWLMFKKTLKIELSDIQKLHVSAFNAKDKTAECDVTQKDGTSLSLTLLSSVTVDGKPAALIGLLGNVEAGWKLFPIHTFSDFQPGELKIEEKKELPAKKKRSLFRRTCVSRVRTIRIRVSCEGNHGISRFDRLRYQHDSRQSLPFGDGRYAKIVRRLRHARVLRHPECRRRSDFGRCDQADRETERQKGEAQGRKERERGASRSQ